MWFSILLASVCFANPLAGPGSAEDRVLSAPAPVFQGMSTGVLADRLEQLGYLRVHESETSEGQYFWGSSRFVVHRRRYRHGGRWHRSRVLSFEVVDDRIGGGAGAVLEPLVFAEDLDQRRARSVPVVFETLPDHVWLPLLALEDSRFFKHCGLDAKAIARATVANIRDGHVVEGGSTLTQQLVKNRRVGPERTLSRKAREAGHALIVDTLYSKEHILEAYLNTVYYGHVDGLGIYGLGAASEVYFSKPATSLTLPEAATLAAVVQGPNALSPIKHPKAALARRDRAIDRLESLGWISAADATTARTTRLGVHKRAQVGTLAADLIATVDVDRPGATVETTLDPYLQAHAERIAQSTRGEVSLIALDASTGDVLAWVGTNPKRQPGSTVKPFVLLSAFSHCSLGPASRVQDGPLSLSLGNGESWEPRNADGQDRGAVSVREALVDSRNRPLVRISEHCGRDTIATGFTTAGLQVASVPASLPLGSVETTPLALAGAYAAFANGGTAWAPVAIERIETPRGRRLQTSRPRSHRMASAADAWLVHDILEEVISEGTGSRAQITGSAAGKTGTSSGGRDAWFAGYAGSVVTVVWVGADGGLSGGRHAAPIWRDFMEEAVPARPPLDRRRPKSIVEGHVDRHTGLRVGANHRNAETEIWRRGHAPRRDWPLVADTPSTVVDVASRPEK